MASYVTSADGTPIAYEAFGWGAPVILVSGALQGRASFRPYARELAQAARVFLYDRRGRGDSGDATPYAVQREVEDLAALIDEAGGRASVYGHSSGAALVLHAAAAALPIDKIVLHEPPFGSGSNEEQQAARREAEHIAALLDQGRAAEVVEYFFTSTGLPPEMAAAASEHPGLIANAPTLLYDPYEVTGPASRGGKTPVEQAAGVDVPALVLAGGSSPEWMIDACRRIAEALPQGRLHVLDRHAHVVPPQDLAPVLAKFLAA